MYLISLKMEDEIYVIGTGGESNIDLRFFNTVEDFIELLKSLYETGNLNNPEDLALAATIVSSEPKYHEDELGELMDIIEEETEVVVVSEKGEDDPFLTLIKCRGIGAKNWRDNGTPVITDNSDIITSENRPPSAESFKISGYTGGIH